ncbi:hypothetical protein EVA_15432 [gut metagenome]|uniref:Uncharacterized protein n=1 Tax=gut metagenome TaxID=749906 RepID=J9G3R1_9ZZZZ
MWRDMREDTLIAKKGYMVKTWTDPFRFQREAGYYSADVSFTTKDGQLLQKDDVLGNDGKLSLNISCEQMLQQTSGAIGEYTVVPYDQWKPSLDGYFYFRATEEMAKFVGNDPAKGVF